MQFHLNGYTIGDPAISASAKSAGPIDHQQTLPDDVDVLIVGTGPAGLTLAAQLAAFPEIRTLIVEQNAGPLQLGRADGVACRTMEMFEAFGFSERVLKEAYWVNETRFWNPDPNDATNIVRTARVRDTEVGLSQFPHVIINQARVHDFYLDVMRNAPNPLGPVYNCGLTGLHITPPDASGNDQARAPVEVTLQHRDPEGQVREHTVRAQYVVGCDGARSGVRKALGLELRGDSASKAWGVMDVLATTDFPDVRFKALIQSAAEGSILLIPREGGYLFRLYIELETLREGERVASRNITADDLVAAARRILSPYVLDVKEVAWWSVYEIGQRVGDRFDNVADDKVGLEVPQVFIAGDACHTHSPKAGQGMNVSMQDAFNLGWKLASVIRGQASPQLLQTYTAERRAVAKELIDFDREWAAMLSTSKQAQNKPVAKPAGSETPQSYFVRHGRYTAGTATHYAPSLITAEAPQQALAEGLVVGMRFHSAPVIRLADARPMELGHTVKADGRWRLFAFAGDQDPSSPGCRIRSLCDFLANSASSPVRRYTPAGWDIDSVIDVRAVFPREHHTLAIEELHPLLLPLKGTLGLCDYEKVFCADPTAGSDIFELRGIERQQGCMVVVRPDQYIASVLPLDAHAELASFFERFMVAGTNVTAVR